MILAMTLILLAQSEVPHVEVNFTTLGAGDWKARRFSEIVPAETIKRIVRFRESGFATGPSTVEEQRAYDALFAHLFASNETAGDWGLGGNESTRAELMVLTKAGELIHLKIVGVLGTESASAILIHGGGRGARIRVKDFKYSGRKK